MEIVHVALWTERLEELRAFYISHFGGTSGEKYINPAKGFESYMIRFDTGCALELMRRTDIRMQAAGPELGFCHIAFGCASREEVLARTEVLRKAGVRIVGEPRRTGDGYFESIVEDPDGNLLELTCMIR